MKNPRVAVKLRLSEARTSMAWPCWSIAVDPPASDLDVSFIDEPPISRSVPTGSCRVDKQRGEPLNPPIYGHVIHGDAPFRQQLLHVSVGQPVAQVPSHRHHDHLWWEAETGEARPRGGRSGMTTAHQLSLPARGDPPMQQCPRDWLFRAAAVRGGPSAGGVPTVGPSPVALARQAAASTDRLTPAPGVCRAARHGPFLPRR